MEDPSDDIDMALDRRKERRLQQAIDRDALTPAEIHTNDPETVRRLGGGRSESKHTPGGRRIVEGDGVFFVMERVEDGDRVSERTVATCFYIEDARPIAAAPEMYEACEKYVIPTLEKYAWPFNHAHHTLEVVRAAIAKAAPKEVTP